MLDGGNDLGTGNDTASFGTSTATGAGITKNESVAIDLTGFVGGGDISDYDLIGVRFSIIDVTNDDPQGSTLDNVSLTVAVPEPSSLALLGLCGTGLFFRRKRA